MHFVWALGLFTLTVFLFSLPLWPAFWELARKSTRTLPIDRDDDGSARYAATLTAGHQLTDFPSHIELRAGSVSHDVVYAVDSIYVEPDCQFSWLDAKTITFAGTSPTTPDSPSRSDTLPIVIKGARAKFQRVESDWQTPPAVEIVGDYVVTHDAVVASDTVVVGNIKAYGHLRVCRGAVVHGSVFAKMDITIESGATVFGVVSASQQVTMLAGSAVGHMSQLSSVSAPVVVVHAGAVVHGSVKAQTLGRSQA
jgi:cytoskeletal protein CcmA (bactofilin family)